MPTPLYNDILDQPLSLAQGSAEPPFPLSVRFLLRAIALIGLLHYAPQLSVTGGNGAYLALPLLLLLAMVWWHRTVLLQQSKMRWLYWGAASGAWIIGGWDHLFWEPQYASALYRGNKVEHYFAESAQLLGLLLLHWCHQKSGAGVWKGLELLLLLDLLLRFFIALAIPENTNALLSFEQDTMTWMVYAHTIALMALVGCQKKYWKRKWGTLLKNMGIWLLLIILCMSHFSKEQFFIQWMRKEWRDWISVCLQSAWALSILLWVRLEFVERQKTHRA